MLRILPTGIQSCSDSQDPERCAFIPSVGCTILYPGALSLYAGSIARSRHLVTFPPFFCTTTHPANNQDQSLLSFCVGVLIGKRSCESKSPLVNLVSSSLVIQRSLCLGLRFVTQQWMTAFEQGVDALMHTVGNTMHTAQRPQGAMHPINWITSNGILPTWCKSTFPPTYRAYVCFTYCFTKSLS